MKPFKSNFNTMYSIVRDKKIIVFLSLTMAISGFIGFAILVAIAPFMPWYIELPLGKTSTFAIDKNDNIYIAEEYYSRVQKYSSNGEFIRSWSVNSNWGGSFHIRYDNKNDRVVVAVRKRRVIDHFTLNGILIKSIPNDFYDPEHPLQIFSTPLPDVIKDSKGNAYTIEGCNIYPRVTRVNKDGRCTTIVRTPFYLVPFRGPVQSFALMLLGILLYHRVGYKKEYPPP